jgi:drug/metabolite transporter superfamily protein YnfA
VSNFVLFLSNGLCDIFLRYRRCTEMRLCNKTLGLYAQHLSSKVVVFISSFAQYSFSRLVFVAYKSFLIVSWVLEVYRFVSRSYQLSHSSAFAYTGIGTSYIVGLWCIIFETRRRLILRSPSSNTLVQTLIYYLVLYICSLFD